MRLFTIICFIFYFVSFEIGNGQDFSLDGDSIVFHENSMENGISPLTRRGLSNFFTSDTTSAPNLLMLSSIGVGSMTYEHSVRMLDAMLAVVKSGGCEAGLYSIPLALIQIKLFAPSLPLEYRRSWHYGVIFYSEIVNNEKKPFPKSERFYLVINGHNYSVNENTVEYREPAAYISPIIWDDERAKYGDKLPYRLERSDKVEIRKIDWSEH